MDYQIEHDKPVMGNEFDKEFIRLLTAAWTYYNLNCKKMVSIESFTFNIKNRTEKVKTQWSQGDVDKLRSIEQR